MALVNVTGVEVGKNPSLVTDGFQFGVVFECLERLEHDLEWKLTYVGSSEDKSYDQELDCVVMGPVNRGALKFTFEADPPNFGSIPTDDIHGFTIILLTGAYRDEEFIRIGWYVHNVYIDPQLQECPPEVPDLSKMQRIILTEAPRVTRFKISWDNPKLLPETAAASGDEEDDAVMDAMREVHGSSSVVLDPHTAAGGSGMMGGTDDMLKHSGTSQNGPGRSQAFEASQNQAPTNTAYFHPTPPYGVSANYEATPQLHNGHFQTPHPFTPQNGVEAAGAVVDQPGVHACMVAPISGPFGWTPSM